VFCPPPSRIADRLRQTPDCTGIPALLSSIEKHMQRTTITAALLLACALWLAGPLLAQYSSTPGASGYPALYGAPAIYAPEIHLGSAYEPTTITVPSEAIAISPVPAPPNVSNAPPASTELLSTRHFDFITSPLDQAMPGSMEDTSISLGEYARQLRAQKQQPFPSTVPNAIAGPPSRWK
jgi:hypothetical protein